MNISSVIKKRNKKSCVLNKTRDDLKPSACVFPNTGVYLNCFWANLVPKIQTDWNLVQAYIAICLNFCHSYFLGKFVQVLSTFSKLTEISYRGILLYAYYDFNIYFFKILFLHILWANLVPKSEVLRINWSLVQGLHCYILITILMSIFPKFLSLMFFWAN